MPQMKDAGHMWQQPKENAWLTTELETREQTMCYQSPDKREILEEIRSHMNKQKEIYKDKDQCTQNQINAGEKVAEAEPQESEIERERQDLDKDLTKITVLIEGTEPVNECEETGEAGIAINQRTLGEAHQSLSTLPGVSSDIQSVLPTYVFVYIHGKPVRALVDSGATLTMMNSELMGYIPELRNDILTPGTYQNMRSIDGSLIPLAGELQVNLNFDGDNVNFGVVRIIIRLLHNRSRFSISERCYVGISEPSFQNRYQSITHVFR